MDNQPNFHDGFLDGLIASKEAVRVFLRTVRGEKFTLFLEGVSMLTVNGFREGNIILGLDFLEPAQLELDPKAAADCDLPIWVEKAKEKQLRAVEISPSYGGTLLAIFQRHAFVEGYEVS